jgi:hypothetical protein
VLVTSSGKGWDCTGIVRMYYSFFLKNGFQFFQKIENLIKDIVTLSQVLYHSHLLVLT